MSKSQKTKLTRDTAPLPVILRLLEVTKSPDDSNSIKRQRLIKRLFKKNLIDLEMANYLAE